MKQTISYREYFDRVYGCFLGKCIGGTAGGPSEGRKELLDFPLNEELLHVALPNDDLDLQVMWLELLEERGIGITARDMGQAFYEKVPYGPGEYGYFLKNYGRGIYPPLSGRYNNRYYKNGMGCPIRSEIWGCLFPGAPERTRHYVEMDGSLDHEHDSIEAEYFLASMEADAFFVHDRRALIERALSRLEPETKIARVLRTTLDAYDAGRSWRETRGEILRGFGHSDCTNMYQNMGFILLALLWGEGDFRETIRIGLACGYDTDCICASAASVLGILRGAERLLGEDGMSDTGLKIEVRTRRRTGSIADLARDVCAAGMTMADVFPDAADIIGRPAFTPIPTETPRPPFTIAAEYEGDPVLRYAETTRLTLCVTSALEVRTDAALTITPPEGVLVSPSAVSLTLTPGETIRLPLTARTAPGVGRLSQKNLFRAALEGDFGRCEDVFGLVGGDVWYRYGPFLMNNRELPDLPPHLRYGPHLAVGEGEARDDVLRDFHLSNFADIRRPFVPEEEPFTAIAPDGRAECRPQRLCLGEDLFDLAEIQSFEGPHTDYLVRYLESPEERRVELALGHTAPFRLWINGVLVGESDKSAWWTCENRHFHLTFRRGVNVIILKCAQVSDHAKYSFIPRIEGGRWRQWDDFVSLLSEEDADR